MIVSSGLGKTEEEENDACCCCCFCCGWFSLVFRISAARSVRFPFPVVGSATAETVGPPAATPSLFTLFTVAGSASFSGCSTVDEGGVTGRRGCLAEPSPSNSGSIAPSTATDGDSARLSTSEPSTDDDPQTNSKESRPAANRPRKNGQKMIKQRKITIKNEDN